MLETFKALKQIIEDHKDIKLLYPVHLNPIVQKTANEILSNHERIKLCNPIDVVHCHNIMANSYLIVTDSGGIQEEAPSLNVPVVVLRNTTERPEGLKANTLTLAGTSYNKVYRSINNLLTNNQVYKSMQNAKNPFGDGNTSQRIADVLEFGKCNEFLS